ncbi:hypothetical protein GCM10007931_02550 [Vibrio algivorus]|uniref:Lipoprotein n=1 Tax=Vibrio algivorus TaxID=1667024 RepID=A0ABQ6EJX6_9VIBR|nr:hypothetical protein GCM10007931_02550 [Vibrio algivorus]
MKKITFSLLALTVLGLSGCGQTGPLYLPDEEPAPVNTGEVSISGSDGGTVTVKPVETEQPEPATESTQPAEAQDAE